MIRRFRRAPAFTGFVLFITAIMLNVIVQGIYSGNPLAFFKPVSIGTLVMSNAQFLLVCMAQSLLLISGTMDLSIGIQLALVNVGKDYDNDALNFRRDELLGDRNFYHEAEGILRRLEKSSNPDIAHDAEVGRYANRLHKGLLADSRQQQSFLLVL